MIFILFAALLSACSPNSDRSQERFITVGTGGVTGVYYPTGGAICRMVKKNRAQHNIRCNVESTGGSIYNINTLGAGELSLGVAQADTAFKAWHGHPPFNNKQEKLRAVAALHPEIVSLVTRASANIKTLADVRGKRINTGNPGSGSERTASELFRVCGISKDDLAHEGRLKAAEMPDALRDGKLDGYFYVVGHPTANIKDAASSAPSHLVPLNTPCVAHMVAEHEYYVAADIPGGLYKGIDQATPSFGVKALLVTTTEAPEDVIYNVAKALFENIDDFRNLHPALRQLTAESMREGVTVPFHSGVEKYFRERNWKY
ncbi:MAG: TAXI family TRAP transporter solute-binding subunit [Magnetococcales bacterium]|nr:TAXI family TRAP transporter solute-binding subunit [Magnetococcales bacterium]